MITDPDNNDIQLPPLDEEENDIIIDVEISESIDGPALDEPLSGAPPKKDSGPKEKSPSTKNASDDDGVITSAMSNVPPPKRRTTEEKRRDPSLDPTILGRYKILDVLGRGAFSIVYRAEQLGIGRIVALKVFLLPPATRQNSSAAESALVRFQREARLAASLRHPNTVTLFDYDQTDAGILYMAFEYVKGPTLSQEIKNCPEGMAPKRAIDITRQVLDSLEEAHGQGIIHRDLKPGNIMLTRQQGRDDYTKVLDFGIAKLVGNTERNPDFDGDKTNEIEVMDLVHKPPPDVTMDLTLNGRIVGTPRYIPPEQIHSRRLQPSADVYALGLILHEMLAGVPANPGRDARDLISWHIEDRPFQTPWHFDCPEGLAAIIHRATQKEPKARYPSCKAFLADLERLDEHGEWATEPPKPKTVQKIVVANVALLLLLGILGFILFGDRFNSAPAAQPEPPTKAEEPASAAPAKAPKQADPVEAPKEPKAIANKASEQAGSKTAPENTPPESEVQQIEVKSIPPGADVYVGLIKLGRTPMPMTVEPDQRQLELTFKKWGYVDRTVTWEAGSDKSPFPVRLRALKKKPPTKKGPGKGYHILP